MLKVLRIFLIIAYGVLFLQYLRISFTANEDVIELEYVVRPRGTLLKILRKINFHNSTKLHFSYEKPDRLPTDLKFILKWTHVYSHFGAPNIRTGQSAFIENKCVHFNCYLTTDKSLLIDPRYFDAILFDVENYWDHPPVLRAAHQKYIFTASKSASDYPICHSFYDEYYNLTWTYKLDSDIKWSFIIIEDKKGNVIGPKIDMKWIEPTLPTPESVVQRLVHKKKAAAWFVSQCVTKSGREHVAKRLAKELQRYNLKIDIYGFCGEITCSRDRMDECLELLEEDYYFYLSFENALSEDYVSEKLIYPLRHMTVPIVYGGANYSRFLPPGSFINAVELNVSEVAFLMDKAISNPEEYRKYFRWHNHYAYRDSPKDADLCELCKVLNDPSKEHAAVKNFRRWWNPRHQEDCRNELKETLQRSNGARRKIMLRK